MVKRLFALLTLYFQHKEWYIVYPLNRCNKWKMCSSQTFTQEKLTENVIFHEFFMSKYVQ